ncbi:linear amide C-N hydrolase [Planctomycetaceae bacterium SH139]
MQSGWFVAFGSESSFGGRLPNSSNEISARAATFCLVLILLFLPATQIANACSRAVYFGKAGQTVTGRTMDWQEDMQTNLWVFPRGMQRDGGMWEQGFSRQSSVFGRERIPGSP